MTSWRAHVASERGKVRGLVIARRFVHRVQRRELGKGLQGWTSFVAAQRVAEARALPKASSRVSARSTGSTPARLNNVESMCSHTQRGTCREEARSSPAQYVEASASRSVLACASCRACTARSAASLAAAALALAAALASSRSAFSVSYTHQTLPTNREV